MTSHGPLRSAFDESAASSPALESCDIGLIAAGRAIADRVDRAIAEADGQELTKALYLVPHLINVLRELLATPQSRANVAAKAGAGKPAPPVVEQVSRLAQLRDQQGRKRTA